MSVIAKLSIWCQVTLLCSLGGIGLGLACDQLLWEWSYDYVFPVAYCRNGGLRLGFLLGTMVAAAATIGRRPLPSWQWMTAWCWGTMMATTMIALVAASLAWALAKWGGIGRMGDNLPPLSRLVFCSTLVSGAFYGAWLIAMVSMIAVWRQRTLIGATLSCAIDETQQNPHG